jgi:hypothetical protein
MFANTVMPQLLQAAQSENMVQSMRAGSLLAENRTTRLYWISDLHGVTSKAAQS